MEKIYFTGKDGLKRSGIYHEHGDRAIVVGCHGLFSWKGDETSKFARIAGLLASEGISFFRFDCTGCGESEGRFINSTLDQRIVDFSEAISYIKKRHISRVSIPFFFIGSSFGGPVITVFTNRNPSLNVKGLITWSSPMDLYEFYKSREPKLFSELKIGNNVEVREEDRVFSLGPQFLNSLEQTKPFKEMKNLSNIPLLIIHGTDDKTVPVTQAELFHEQYPGIKTLVIIPGAEHRLLNSFNEVAQRSTEWILQCLD